MLTVRVDAAGEVNASSFVEASLRRWFAIAGSNDDYDPILSIRIVPHPPMNLICVVSGPMHFYSSHTRSSRYRLPRTPLCQHSLSLPAKRARATLTNTSCPSAAPSSGTSATDFLPLLA